MDRQMPATAIDLPLQFKKSFINDDVFRQAIDEETNYLKFVMNEMGPSYGAQRNRVVEV